MCNTRAYKYNCGHVSTHLVSTCRGTYASPDTERVLCHASPTLVVAAHEQCRTCQWISFSRLWDSRIEEAQSKLSVATQVQMELQEDWMDAEVPTAIEGNDLCEADRACERLAAAKEESERARTRVDYLVGQYEREKRQRWRPARANVATQPDPKIRAPTLCRKGSSPLKKSQSITDVTFQRATPPPKPDDESDTDSEDRESFESGSGSSSSVGLTDDTSDNDDSPPHTPLDSPRFRKKAFSFSGVGSTWSKGVSDAPVQVIGSEEVEEMLPNFGCA